MTDEFDAMFSGRQSPQKSFAERMGYAPESAAPQPQPNDSDGIYKPYGFFPSGAIGEVCDVRRWMDGTTVAEGVEFQYRFLIQVGYVGDTELRLFFPTSMISVTGEGLTELRKKLARRTVTFIQQFSAQIWQGKPEGPLVRGIEIFGTETPKSK